MYVYYVLSEFSTCVLCTSIIFTSHSPQMQPTPPSLPTSCTLFNSFRSHGVPVYKLRGLGPATGAQLNYQELCP